MRCVSLALWLVACGGLEVHRVGAEPHDPPEAPAPVPPHVASDAVPDAPDLSEALFSESELPVFDLELTDEALEALRAEPYTWTEGALIYRGVRFDPVGIRIKGQNSFQPIDAKPSLKVKLDHVVDGWELLGLEELTLDNMVNDPSMMHERVAYRLYRAHGVPAARATHAVVRINGVDRGLYTHVENVDDRLLARWYADADGSMWEHADTDFTVDGVAAFEHEEGPDDRAALLAVAEALAVGGPDVWTDLAAWLDTDQFLAYTGASAVVAQFDSYPWFTPGDDCHWYLDPTTHRLQILPHGVDETFTFPWHDILVQTDGLLLAACLTVPDCAADYADAVWAAQATSEAIDLAAYAAEVRAQIEPLVEADAYQPYTLDEVVQAQDLMLEVIEERPTVLSILLDP